MRTCFRCRLEFTPSSRHRRCPSCRAKEKPRKPCQGCGKPVRCDWVRCRKCASSRENNGRWNGGRTRHKKGYVQVRLEGRYVFEHVLVMEKKLGRSLLPGETVHHRNGVKDDNRRRNLELWARSHPSGCRVRDLLQWAREILETYK